MATVEIGLYIGLYAVRDQAQLASHPVAADGYDEHIRGAQEAEHMGYQYYWWTGGW